MTEKRSLVFAVQDVDGDIHHVTIEQEVNNSVNLSALCTCSQANEESFCVHRFDILEGHVSNVVSENMHDLATLKKWIVGSDIEAAMTDLARAKSEMRMAMEKVEYCRRKLARRMLD